MAVKALVPDYRAPFKGLNNRLEPYLLDPSMAQAARDVQVASGAIRGLEDLGASVGTADAATDQFIWYAGGSRWISKSYKAWALNDGNRTYFTRNGQPPQIAIPGTIHDLGILPPGALSFSQVPGGQLSAGTYKYAVTFATDDGRESNAQTFDLSFTVVANGKVTLNLPTSSDPRVTKRKIWRTQVNGAIFYLLSVVENNATAQSYVDNQTDDTELVNGTNLPADYLDLGVAPTLAWAPGGYPMQSWETDKQYTEDHSPAPVLTVIANALHSNMGDVGVSGSGILFGGNGNVARWSRLGYPDYWPILNYYPLPDEIEAIYVGVGVTYYLTRSSIYQARGNSDDALAWEKTNSSIGIRAGQGKSCVQTPYGLIFLAREGICVFDGSNSHPFSDPHLDNDWLLTLDVTAAAYFDNQYVLFHSTGTLIVDLHGGIANAKFFTSEIVCLAAHSTDFSEPVVAEALASRARQMRRQAGCSNGVNRFYVLGGSYVSTSIAEFPEGTIGEKPSNLFTYYDTVGRKWTDLTSYPNYIVDSAMVMLNTTGVDYIYAAGGLSNDMLSEGSASSEFYRFDPNGNSWAAMTAMPNSLAGAAIATDGTYVYVFGGYNGGGASEQLYRYNPATNTWSTLQACTGYARKQAAMVYITGKLYVFGGADSSTTARADILIYDISSSTWSVDSTASSAASWAARFRCTAGAYNGKAYVYGGTADGLSPMSDIWEYTPGTGWTNTVGEAINMGGRQRHAAAMIGSMLYVQGGVTTTGFFNDDAYRADLANLLDGSSVPGMYVLQAADAGSIRRWRDGDPRLWLWQTGDYLGDDEQMLKTYQRITVDCEGDLVVRAVIDGEAPRLLKTITGATRSESQRFWLPRGGSAVRGRRISFQIEATSTGAVLHRLRAEGYQDG